MRIVWEVQSEITFVKKTELPKMLEPIMFRQESERVEILGKNVATKSNVHQERLIHLAQMVAFVSQLVPVTVEVVQLRAKTYDVQIKHSQAAVPMWDALHSLTDAPIDAKAR